ncbi:NAD(P)-binding protein [Pleurostoma richardsiae]|uniref:NAD(P)-binding protein n=1 Tax=Pleurostoma richardsiae TaxID=41990 RepID=A0AA38S2A3_9PEZI|nr:NAD(P)-binding protein [Pleurostoma richardsiae]
MSAPLVALITAGSAGLGAATARLFARNGLRVVINYSSNRERAEGLVAELQGLSPLSAPAAAARPNFAAVQADLSRRDDVARLVADAVGAMGRLDVVFSNGGWTRLRDITDLEDNVDEDDWDRCFNMNVKSHLWLMHAAKKHLEETEGAFVTTASLAGVKVSGSSLPYAVTKAAQIHLAKGLAIIAAPKIRVNTVSPGLMLTEWGQKFSPEQQQAITDQTRLKRLATVEDVAEQVLCFVRSKSVTGTNAVIDSGLSI